VAFAPDGSRLATVDKGVTVRVRDPQTGKVLVQMSGHTDAVTDVAFSPDGSRVLTVAADRTARVWDARTGAELLVLPGLVGPGRRCAWSADGRHLYATDDALRVWQTRDQKN
jgi:WD40 repeat protein